MDNPELHDVRLRLGRLEREVRWWRLGALGAMVLLVALGAAPRGTTLEAERLVIRDAKGTVRAVLGTETVGRGLPSFPMGLGLSKELPPDRRFGLYVYREDGVEAAGLTLTSDGEPFLILRDRQDKADAAISAFRGHAGVELHASKIGLAEFGAEYEALVKRAEREKWSENTLDNRLKELASGVSLNLAAQGDLQEFHVHGQGESGSVLLSGNPVSTMVSVFHEPFGSRLDILPEKLQLFDQNEGRKPRVLLGLSDDDAPFLALRDKDGQTRAVLGRTGLESIKTGAVDQRAESSLVLFDREGKVLWQAP